MEIEDDSLRDGLQGAFTTKPTLTQRIELLELSHAVGTRAAMIGFPASHAGELEDCRAMVRAIESKGLDLVPRCLARATVADLEPIAALHRESQRGVTADFFIGSSRLRSLVESWTLEEVLKRVEASCKFLRESSTPFGISIEDATRATPEDLEQILRVAISGGAGIVTICDTAGDATASGTARLLGFVFDQLRAHGSDAKVWWHGHNDRGLAFANAVAAIEAGVHTVSGSFLGIGERTGNTALEQVVVYLHQRGASRYKLDRLLPYCEALARYTDTPIPANMPIVGSQAFATCTGTHTAAIVKARAFSVAHEDYVFSSIPASQLGRGQNILIGPTSGLANARYILEQLGVAATDERARELLAFARTQSRWLSKEDIARHLAANGTQT